jgi:hypothetical protein
MLNFGVYQKETAQDILKVIAKIAFLKIGIFSEYQFLQMRLQVIGRVKVLCCEKIILIDFF